MKTLQNLKSNKSRTSKQTLKANSFIEPKKKENLCIKTPKYDKKKYLDGMTTKAKMRSNFETLPSRMSNLTPSEKMEKIQATAKIHQTKTMIKEKFQNKAFQKVYAPVIQNANLISKAMSKKKAGPRPKVSLLCVLICY